MKLSIDHLAIQHIVNSLRSNLADVVGKGEVPILEYQDELGETYQLTLVATKKLPIDYQKLRHVIHGLSGDLNEVCDTSEVPVCEYQNELGETCQLKLVATKDKGNLILGGEQFYCISQGSAG